MFLCTLIVKLSEVDFPANFLSSIFAYSSGNQVILALYIFLLNNYPEAGCQVFSPGIIFLGFFKVQLIMRMQIVRLM